MLALEAAKQLLAEYLASYRHQVQLHSLSMYKSFDVDFISMDDCNMI